MKRTVSFARNALNVFFHILTRCNLKCRHCYINPQQHGTRTLDIDTTNVETLVPAIEELFGTKFLSPEVYYISDVPSDMRWPDVATICSVAFVMCVVATIYPAWRASRTNPAEALRYE